MAIETIKKIQLDDVIEDAKNRFALIDRVLDITNGEGHCFNVRERTGIWEAFHSTIKDMEALMKRDS